MAGAETLSGTVTRGRACQGKRKLTRANALQAVKRLVEAGAAPGAAERLQVTVWLRLVARRAHSWPPWQTRSVAVKHKGPANDAERQALAQVAEALPFTAMAIPASGTPGEGANSAGLPTQGEARFVEHRHDELGVGELAHVRR